MVGVNLSAIFWTLSKSAPSIGATWVYHGGPSSSSGDRQLPASRRNWTQDGHGTRSHTRFQERKNWGFPGWKKLDQHIPKSYLSKRKQFIFLERVCDGRKWYYSDTTICIVDCHIIVVQKWNVWESMMNRENCKHTWSAKATLRSKMTIQDPRLFWAKV